MKIVIARQAGFCMGVRRAVEMVLEASTQYPAPICTFGPLIHNPQVLNILEEKGIRVLKEVPEKGKGTVLIRAHGVPPEIQQRLRDAGFTVLDATCPHVIKVQTIIQKHTRQGYASIIIGDRDHPEVIGLYGYAGKSGYVVGTREELDALPIFEKAIVVAQTTQNNRFFHEVQTWVEKNAPRYRLFNTICDATEKRQAEVTALAETVDAVVVVGGRNSGNTNRLVEIVRNTGKPVFHVETEAELNPAAFTSVQTIGITAGASTPSWIIRKVYRTLESVLIKREGGWRRGLFHLQRALLLTNIYLSLGAGGLCFAASKLQGFPASFLPVLMAMLYVLSMHIFNHLTGRKSDRYNDPDKALFYSAHRRALTLLAVVAGVAGLSLAFAAGRVPFLILLAMSVTGVSYNIRLIPGRVSGGRYLRIRDIPGSKTVLIALAWGLVTTVVPSIILSHGIRWQTAPVFLWATALVFVRTAFFDILDMQGDRIVGRETLPILLGEQRSIRLLKSIMLGTVGVLLLGSLVGAVPPLGIGLTIGSIFLYIVLTAYEQGRVLPGIGLEFLVETHLVLSGIIVWGAVLLSLG